ncbi:hypothetical protein [Streptomyces sp. NPDC020480]|uniref:hypothetical protein n=1 Tax=Streptomyces sp. NPDC020480 TaxID=3365076 RepID=UPI0037A76A43
MTTATARAVLKRGIPHTSLVLAKRTLAPGARLTTTSRFGDDVWNLAPALTQRHQPSLILNFLTLPTPFRQVAKELFYAFLRNDLPPGQVESRITSIRSRFSLFKEFSQWLTGRGIDELRAVTAEDLKAYSDFIDAQHLSELTKSKKRNMVRLVWFFRTKLISDGLTLDPATAWPEVYDRAGVTSRRVSRENSTDRIPEQVLAPLIVWSLRWLEDFADDILRAQQELVELRTQPNLGHQSSPEERLRAMLDGYRKRGHRLPRAVGGRGVENDRVPVNFSHLARKAQVHVSSLYRDAYMTLVMNAVEELGLDDRTYLDTEVRGLLDGEPWQPAFDWVDLDTLVRMLLISAYCVTAYFSGMRDAEVKHLKRGCLRVWRDEHGNPVRYKVTSQAFKGEDTPLGVEATWVVNAAVARAIEVLEALQAPDQNYLFAHPPASRSHRKSNANSVQTGHSTSRNLDEFVRWTNAYCAQRGRTDQIGDVNGKPWKFTTSQFRRTLAWSIARQPGGSIAGAIQYRHHSVQMFEGYAGTSTSGFRHEVEAEAALARGEKLGDIILNPAPIPIVGPAAEEIESRLSAFEHDVQFLGKVITDRKRLARHMKRHDPHIYPGEFVTCVYNPDRALCRRNGADGPSLPDCQPFKCRNVALTAENADAFLAWRQRLERALANGVTLAPYVRDRMEQRRAELAEFLEANNIPTSTPEETVR